MELYGLLGYPLGHSFSANILQINLNVNKSMRNITTLNFLR